MPNYLSFRDIFEIKQASQALFVCGDCGLVKESKGGIKYRLCDECVKSRDYRYMVANGKAKLYLRASGNKAAVQNFTGTLNFPCYEVKKGENLITKSRYDVWFVGPNNEKWYGIKYGKTNVVHCVRLKD